MLNHKFLKKVKNFILHFKFLSLSIVVMAIAIPFIVKAAYNSPSTGYLSLGNISNFLVFHNKADGITVDPLGICISNSTSINYFIPTKTLAEWTAFFNNTPAGISLSTCCGDGVCNGSETCSSCPSECGACAPTPCQYVYSAWSSCDYGAANRTRTITSYGPVNCAPGTQEALSVACCSGCITGNKCMNQTIYNGLNCSGNILSTQTNQCTSNSTTFGCVNMSPVSANVFAGSGCSHECHTLIQGCPAGESCRNTAMYVDGNGACSGAVTANQSAVCAPTSVANGVCQNYYSSPVHIDVLYSAGSGCSYYSD